MTAIKLYRIANKCYLMRVPLLPKFFYRMIYLINNCHVHYATKIGIGTKLAYGGIGVVIHKDAVIGKNCVIESNVTIGGRSNKPQVPVIKDNVLIGTGASILGPIQIGNNCTIGAGSVVIHDVPDNCVVAGIPAKIIRENVKSSDVTSIGKIVDYT